MRKTLILIFGFVVVLSSSVATAQSVSFEPSPYIFRLKISNCGDHEPTNRRQTGFRVQGVIGIVTALHGVADCSLIHALSDGDGPNFKNLQIQAVDIDHDVALLTSPELLELPADGLPVMVDQELQIDQLQLIGYPLGLDEQDIVIDVSINYSRTLKSLIPKSDLPESLRERNSPNLDTKVFRVQTHLVPGHSGSPLLDSAGRVIAVANGGLKQGTVEIGWAMPWQDIIWQDILPAATADKAVLDRFAELKTQNPQFALAFSSTYPPTIEQNEQDITMVGTVVGVSAEAIRDAEVTLTLIDAYYVALTDDNGKFQFSLDPDNVEKFREILVERDGYQDRRLNVFDQLPQSIQLEVVRAPAPVNLEISDYVRVIWSTGINLHQSPRSDSPIKDELSEGRLLQILEGPEQQKEQKWWQVRLLGSSNQTGWVVASSDSDIYLERLPFFVHDDKVKVTAESRLRLRQTPGTNTRIIGALESGDEATVYQGPEEANGYLWYELLDSNGQVIGWVAAISNEGVFLEQIEDLVDLSQMPISTPQPTATPIPPVTPRDATAPQAETPVKNELILLKPDGIESSSVDNKYYPPSAAFDKDPTASWGLPNSKLIGSWLKVLFREPQVISRIGLYRQPGTTSQILEANLIFADGTSQQIKFGVFDEWNYVDIAPVVTNEITIELLSVSPKGTSPHIFELALWGNQANAAALPTNTPEQSQSTLLKPDGIESSSVDNRYYPPEAAFDKDPVTSWGIPNSKLSESWLKVLFREPKTISRIGLYRQPGTTPQIQKANLVFADGSSQAIKFDGFDEWNYVELESVTTNAVTIELVSVYPTGFGPHVFEIALFGPAEAGMAPTTELKQTNQLRITVTGVGFAPTTETNPARRKQYALTAAKADASKNFAAWQVGEDLESVTVIEKNELQIEKITLEIRAKVKGGMIIAQTYDDTTGTAEVTVEYTVDMTQ